MPARIDPWALGALALGTLSFLALPYSLYLFGVVFVAAFVAAFVFLLLSPAILAAQYLRYRRTLRTPVREDLGGR